MYCTIEKNDTLYLPTIMPVNTIPPNQPINHPLQILVSSHNITHTSADHPVPHVRVHFSLAAALAC